MLTTNRSVVNLLHRFRTIFAQLKKPHPFYLWLYREQENKKLLLLSGILSAIQFVLFKYFYPYPNFIPADSLAYIEAASSGQHINYWPIGYSYFLRLAHFFSSSHYLLVALQYVLLVISILYLLFTVSFIIQPGKWVIRGLMALILLNPLLLHISNFILSDALFTSLSIIWFTQLIWILNRPTLSLLLTHAVVLLFAFMVRFNALYFPLISTLIIYLSQAKRLHRYLAIALIAVLLFSFIGHTQYQYHQKTGHTQFSSFGGWQLGANALYGYAHAQPIPNNQVSLRFRDLHILVNKHIDSLRGLPIRPDEKIGIYYLWHERAPLKQHLAQYYMNDHQSDHFTKWSRISRLYSDYGWYLIKQRPENYLQYYIWPNLKYYLVPPAGFMGMYNVGIKSVHPVIGHWFHWKDNNVYTRFQETQISITQYLTILIAIFNLLFILGLAGIIWLLGIRKLISKNNGILPLTLFVWVANLTFSTFSAPIELRYQLFPLIIVQVFGSMVLTLIAKTGKILTDTAVSPANGAPLESYEPYKLNS